MNIAYDTGPLTSGHAVRGIGVNTSELLEALRKQRIGIEKLVIDEFDFSVNRKSLSSSRYDIIHCSFFHPFFLTLPFKVKGKLVVTIHDLIYLIYPKHYPPGIKGKLKFQVQKLLIKKADAIITISETSKKDIVRLLGVKSDKVHVVHLAPKKIYEIKKLRTKEIKKVRNKYNLPRKFVLYVGDVNYNKNIPGLIKACKIAKMPLVIVGKEAVEIDDVGRDLYSLSGPRDWLRFLFNIPHPEIAHYNKLIKEFRKNKQIIRLGFVSDEDLVVIYNLATAYCFPSFYEGFGLSILEAMACGTPVVAGKTQALVEIAEKVALFADPKDPKDIARKITETVKNQKTKEQLIRRGRQQVKEFSWKKTAKETVNIYRLVNS